MTTSSAAILATAILAALSLGSRGRFFLPCLGSTLPSCSTTRTKSGARQARGGKSHATQIQDRSQGREHHGGHVSTAHTTGQASRATAAPDRPLPRLLLCLNSPPSWPCIQRFQAAMKVEVVTLASWPGPRHWLRLAPCAPALEAPRSGPRRARCGAPIGAGMPGAAPGPSTRALCKAQPAGMHQPWRTTRFYESPTPTARKYERIRPRRVPSQSRPHAAPAKVSRITPK